MTVPEFQVNVPSGFSNSDVRSLSDTEKSMAGAMGLSEEQFRQSKLQYLLGEKRRRDRGRDLGEQVERILAELGTGYRLTSVTWTSDTLSWRLEIDTPEGQQNIALSSELVDEALDARTRRELQRLRNMVWFGLGRRDLIFEKHE
jgi:hypothetical protein